MKFFNFLESYNFSLSRMVKEKQYFRVVLQGKQSNLLLKIPFFTHKPIVFRQGNTVI